MKKILAISALSLGFLSSAPLALCAPSGAKNTSGMYIFTGDIKTIKYPPGSFNAEIFNDVLRINGIEEDLRNASRVVEVDPMSNEKTVHLCGNEWECVIKPFNGRDYHVEYIKKLEANEETNKRIIFLFRPRMINGAIIESFNESLKHYGFLKDLICVEKTLKTFMVPTSITEIGNFAFWGCKFLEQVKIPDSVMSIDDGAFFGCESLKEIEIPNSIYRIDKYSFGRCESLKEIVIPNSVTSIGKSAFSECKSLEKITIPESVTSIEDSTFDDCKSLKEIKIPNSVKKIGWGAFNGCKSLKEIEIPNSVTEIGDGAFYECESLEKITIPNSVTSIGKCAFAGCKSLKEIEIPNSVTEIREDVFAGCTSLKEIKWNDHTYGVEEFLEAFKNRL